MRTRLLILRRYRRRNKDGELRETENTALAGNGLVVRKSMGPTAGDDSTNMRQFSDGRLRKCTLEWLAGITRIRTSRG